MPRLPDETPAMSLPDNHPRLLKRPYSQGELLADGFVHAAAIIAGAIAFSVLFVRIALYGEVSDGLAMAIYAASFFLLFGFSCAYNMTPPSPLKWLLRRFDHSSIYLMIAGTYTAAFSQMSDRAWAWTLIGVVWAVSLLGIGLKLFLPGRLDRASVVLYLALGWIAVIAVKAPRRLAADADADSHGRRRPALFVGRRLLQMAQPEVPERHLARLRRHGRGPSLRRHRLGGRPRRRLIPALG
jgi:hemolysin III